MKKISRFVLGAALIAAVPGHGAAQWGGKELKESLDYALEAFLEEKGQGSYDAISGASAERTSSGKAARVKVTYEVSGVKQTQSYFCHTHGSHIDCH